MKPALLTLAAAVVTLAPPTAFAACAPFVAQAPYDLRDAVHADQGDPGPDAGDLTTGRRGMIDADGNPIGHMHWISEMVTVDDDGVPTALDARNIMVLDDGVLFAIGGVGYGSALSNYAEQSGFAPSAKSVLTIVSGVGAYAGAKGTIEIKGDGNDIVYTVDVTCG